MEVNPKHSVDAAILHKAASPLHLLLFSTSDPEPMGQLGDVYHKELKRNPTHFTTKDSILLNYHGEAQKVMGYDIPCHLQGRFKNHLRQKCLLISPFGLFYAAFVHRVADTLGRTDVVRFYITLEEDINDS